jgi:hypothetical protein
LGEHKCEELGGGGSEELPVAVDGRVIGKGDAELYLPVAYSLGAVVVAEEGTIRRYREDVAVGSERPLVLVVERPFVAHFVSGRYW